MKKIRCALPECQERNEFDNERRIPIGWASVKLDFRNRDSLFEYICAYHAVQISNFLRTGKP